MRSGCTACNQILVIRAYQLSKSPNPKDRVLRGQLRDLNEKLIDQIDEAAGGSYCPARQNFKDAKDISAAFESGFDTLKNCPGVSGLEDRPEALKAWMAQATSEEVVARRLGTRADIDQKINAVKKSRSFRRLRLRRQKSRSRREKRASASALGLARYCLCLDGVALMRCGRCASTCRARLRSRQFLHRSDRSAN
jgi:hypothetical protein